MFSWDMCMRDWLQVIPAWLHYLYREEVIIRETLFWCFTLCQCVFCCSREFLLTDNLERTDVMRREIFFWDALRTSLCHSDHPLVIFSLKNNFKLMKHKYWKTKKIKASTKELLVTSHLQLSLKTFLESCFYKLLLSLLNFSWSLIIIKLYFLLVIVHHSSALDPPQSWCWDEEISDLLVAELFRMLEGWRCQRHNNWIWISSDETEEKFNLWLQHIRN